MATLAALTRKVETLENKLLKTQEDLRIAKLNFKNSELERRYLHRDLVAQLKDNEKLAKRIHQLENGAK